MSTIGRVFAVLVSAAAGVAIGYGSFRYHPWTAVLGEPPVVAAPPSSPSGSPSASGAAKSSAAPMSSASAKPSASAAGGPPPSGSASSSAGVSASAAPSASPSSSAAAGSSDTPAACLRTLFSEDTFTSEPQSLAKICEEKSPAKIIKRIKETLVTAGSGKVTGGMKEWGMLGIFELAAISAMRGHCCPGAPRLDVPVPTGNCNPISNSLEAIAAASRPGGSAEKLDAAIATFDQDARCIIRSDQSKAYGDYGPLGGGEGTTLDKTVQRIFPKPEKH